MLRRLAPAVLVGLLACCGRGDANDAPRLVVVGIDSADWSIIDPLIEAGDLPNLARLKDRGAHGDLLTLRDIPLSPVVWTSVATGKGPSAHGITWFLVDTPDGTRVPVRSTNRRTEALWTIADRAGLAVGTVGWWATYPAEDLEHGVVVSDAMGVHGFGRTARADDATGKVSPSGLFPRVDAAMPVAHQIGYDFVSRFVDVSREEFEQERFRPDVHREPNPFNPIHLFQQYAATAQGYTSVARDLIDDAALDALLVYFEQVDSFSHLFMKYDPPRLEWVDERGADRYDRVVREWYRYQDELLGRLLESVNLERTAVLLVSDHGFKVGERRIRSEETVDPGKAHLEHEPEGIVLLCGPGVRRGARFDGATVLDVTPTVLHYLGLPVGKDMEGRVLSELFEDEFLVRQPIRYVSTHESGRVPVTVNAAESGVDPNLEERLRVLGYAGVEDEAENGAGPPMSVELHMGLGRTLLAEGDPDAAEAEFKKALALDENSAAPLLGLAEVHRIRGRTDLAVRLTERALAVNPASPDAISRLAELQTERGDLGEAARLYREAIGITDANPALFVGLGDVLQRAGNLEGAEIQFRRALELDPDDAAATYNLGVTYEAMGRKDEAIASYRAALELDPEATIAANAQNNLGAILREEGRLDEALAMFEQVAKRFPWHLESRFNAAMMHAAAGGHARSVALLREAADIAPSHELVQLQLGLELIAVEEYEDALRALVLVRRLAPKNWQATIGLAVIRARSGNADQARALLAEARALGGEAATAFANGFPALAALGATARDD